VSMGFWLFPLSVFFLLCVYITTLWSVFVSIQFAMLFFFVFFNITVLSDGISGKKKKFPQGKKKKKIIRKVEFKNIYYHTYFFFI
jgi:energy-coupling factor transporter transmembrane protein EcfT